MTVRARVATAAVLAVLLSPGAGPAAAPATAVDHDRGHPGHCTDDRGVTVVVDFGALGGTPLVRCNPQDGRGTGLEALKGAGFQIAGVQRWGESFICRIENRPSATETLPIEGDEHYREACLDTPPASGYWSYWHAGNNCSWEYSQWGVKNRDFVPGGYEGWSFSLNASADANPEPRIAPRRPGPTGQACGAAAAGPTTTESPDAGAGSHVEEPASEPPRAQSTGPNSADGKLPPAKPRPGRASPTARTSDTASDTASDPASGPAFSGGEDAPDVGAAARAETGASALAPWAAGAVLLVLLAGAGVVSRRRRAVRGR